MNETVPDEVLALLSVDRELTADEQARLRAYSEAAMADVVEAAEARAQWAFMKPRIPIQTFAVCVFDHIPDKLRELVAADIYTCPVCGQLLKDRR